MEDGREVLYGWLSGLLAGVSNISHKLRLQLLGAQFTAHVESAFLLGNFLIPSAKIKHGAVVFAE